MIRSKMPKDLQEDVIGAISVQTLAQVNTSLPFITP